MKKSPLIFPPWPSFEEDEIEAVERVLRSGKVNYWTGEECKLFEEDFKQLVGSRFAIALANGTVALEAALYGLGIGPGDDVIVPCRTYVATASCVVMRGARPIFADIDPVSQNITVETIKAVMTPKTRAIIVVHLAGWPCDMDPIMDFARSHGVKVIEDCAQAIGASYKGKSVGVLGDVGAFSFCQDKIITTGGEGGMLTTNNPDVWEKTWALKDHGKSFEAAFHRQHPPGLRWLVESFGTNWRMTEMQAALGRVVLRKLPKWVEARRKNASFLNQRLAGLPGLRLTIPSQGYFHSYYKYYVFLRPECLRPGWDKNTIIDQILHLKIPCYVGACSEVYLENVFAKEKLQPAKRFKTAKLLGETALMFLCHHTIQKRHLEATVEGIKTVLEPMTM